MKYYLFTATTHGWVIQSVFTDYEHLIRFLALHQSGKIDWSRGKVHYNNLILDGINMNFQDEYVTCDWFGNVHRYTRPYVLMDENDTIIDAREFYEDIISFRIPPYERHYPYYVFRRGPVPGTGRHRYKYYHSCRNIHYGQMVRAIHHPDYQEFGRKKKNKEINLISYDYPIRQYDKSWKSSCKCRKQWEKNLDKKKTK